MQKHNPSIFSIDLSLKISCCDSHKKKCQKHSQRLPEGYLHLYCSIRSEVDSRDSDKIITVLPKTNIKNNIRLKKILFQIHVK